MLRRPMIAFCLMASTGLSACVTSDTFPEARAGCAGADTHSGFLECVRSDPFRAATATGPGRAVTLGFVSGALIAAMGGDLEDVAIGAAAGAAVGYTAFATLQHFNARSQAEAILVGRSEISTLPSAQEIVVETEFVRTSLAKRFDTLTAPEKRRLARAWAVLELSERGSQEFIEAGETALEQSANDTRRGAPARERPSGVDQTLTTAFTAAGNAKAGAGAMSERERALAAELARVREINEALRAANLELRRAAMSAE